MSNARSIALRDKPMALLLGIMGSAVAGGFGHEPAPAPDSFGNDHHGYSFSPAFGFDGMGGYNAAFGHQMPAGFGYTASYGADPGAPAPMVPAAPPSAAPNPADPRNHPALVGAWHAMNAKKAKTGSRLALLNPNGGSDVDVEAYVFSLNPGQFSVGSSLLWGTANGWTAFKNPQVSFRAERMFVNVAIPGLVYINTIQAANVNAQIGAIADAFTFSALAQGSRVSLPTLPPQNTMQVTGTWSNVVPAPFVPGQPFTLALDFEGWATVTA